MKLSFAVLALVPLTTAFIVPDQHIFESLAIEEQRLTHYEGFKECLKKCLVDDDDPYTTDDENLKKCIRQCAVGDDDDYMDVDTVGDDLDDATDASEKCHQSMTEINFQEWFDDYLETLAAQDHAADGFTDDHGAYHRNPKPSVRIPARPVPGRGKPGEDPQPEPPNKRPARPVPGPGREEATVYDVIRATEYTTKFAELIEDYPDLVDLLNGTVGKYCVFAPTNAAIERALGYLPDDKKPSKEIIRKVVEYHISPVPYDAYSLFLARTIGTILTEDALGGYKQRLRVGFGFDGLRINFNSRIVAVNAFGTNGVVHAVDNVLLLPPPTSRIPIQPPGDYMSTLKRALAKTGLDKALSEPRTGGTLFAPSNEAFEKLGPKINEFLFGPFGAQYLKALIQYHIVANKTMYSDAYFFGDNGDDLDMEPAPGPKRGLDLPTRLPGKSVHVEISRWGRWMTVKLNDVTTVKVLDVIARDGVIHGLDEVLLPFKLGENERGAEMTVEEFKDLFDPHCGKL